MNKNSAKDIFKLFAALIFLASAALTFSFFYEYLPSIVPDMVDPLTGAIIAGTLGMIIFDGGALAWLKVYLDACDNNDQRNIALSTSVIDISGSAIASFTQIIFAGTGLIELSPETKYFVGLAALIAAAGVLTFNFVSIWRFHKNSDVSKESIREANRLARIRMAEEKEADYLDSLVEQEVQTMLHGEAEKLAREQAARIVKERTDLERAKYRKDGSAPTPPARPRRAATGMASDSPTQMPNGVQRREEDERPT